MEREGIRSSVTINLLISSEIGLCRWSNPRHQHLASPVHTYGIVPPDYRPLRSTTSFLSSLFVFATNNATGVNRFSSVIEIELVVAISNICVHVRRDVLRTIPLPPSLNRGSNYCAKRSRERESNKRKKKKTRKKPGLSLGRRENRKWILR